MQQQRKRSVAGLVAAVVAAMSLAPVEASAQDADVLVAVAEVVEEDVVEDDRQVRFWWSSTDDPQWTETDDAVLPTLQRAGVEPVMPAEVNISRIYRRPELSTDNAAQLGSLMDVEQVLVGQVEYRRVGPVAPLGYKGIEANAQVSLVAAGNTDAVAVDHFELTRRVYGEDPEALLAKARDVGGEALGELMGRSLGRSEGRLGIDEDGQTLALRQVQRADHLEAIRRQLEQLDEIDAAEERWATDGLIALGLELADDARDTAVNYAVRMLEEHDFEEFELVAADDPVVSETVELRLEPQPVDR